MAYLLDSDVLIRAKNQHYAFDICPGFWEWILESNSAGTTYSVGAVYDELAAGDDDLSDWASNNRQLFLSVTQSDIPAIAAVNRWANDSTDYEPAAKSEFAAAADSFLIGQALAGSHVVVTHETISDGRRRIKIPNAAVANGVKYTNPFQMLRIERARLVLADGPATASQQTLWS